MPITRRDFLKLSVHSLLGAASALTVAGLARFLSYKADPPPPQEFDLGPAENFPPGSATVIASIPAIIRNSGGTYSAISMKCTHLGCTVEHKGDTFVCPCHGSSYNKDGRRVKGPAVRDLPSLQVIKNESGDLIVYVG